MLFTIFIMVIFLDGLALLEVENDLHQLDVRLSLRFIKYQDKTSSMLYKTIQETMRDTIALRIK